jgi:hypothetical protein
MERETEPIADASVENGTCQRGSGQVGRKAGGALIRIGELRIGGVRRAVRQPLGEPAGLKGQSPHGVKSAPKADERAATEPENLGVASSCFGAKMIDATDDRDAEGRSPRSSLRAGKPSTRRRRTVGTEGRQGEDACPAR